MLTQPERDALARELGMGPEVCPRLWKHGLLYCIQCGKKSFFCFNSKVDQEYCICGMTTCLPKDEEANTLLPCPLSDDPAACLWDGALMRALDKPGLDPQLILGGGEAYVGTGVQSSEKHYFAKTSTAALYAAWKDIKQCQPNP